MRDVPPDTANDNSVREDDLQAYVDGQLDARRRAAMEAYLAAHPLEAARAAAYRGQNIGLHALFDPLPGPDGVPEAPGDAALPPQLAALGGALDAELLERRRAATTGPCRAGGGRLLGQRVIRFAASLALLLAAGAAAWATLQQSDVQPAARLALGDKTAPAPQTPLQAMPAAAEEAPDAPSSAPAAELADTVTPRPPKSAPSPDEIDPAIERSPLVPVPLPDANNAAKDT